MDEYFIHIGLAFSALTRLGGRKGIRPVKNSSGGVLPWLHMAQLMPLPLTVSSFSKIQIGFIDKGPLNGCVCVCVYNTS